MGKGGRPRKGKGRNVQIAIYVDRDLADWLDTYIPNGERNEYINQLLESSRNAHDHAGEVVELQRQRKEAVEALKPLQDRIAQLDAKLARITAKESKAKVRENAEDKFRAIVKDRAQGLHDHSPARWASWLSGATAEKYVHILGMEDVREILKEEAGVSLS